MVMPAVGRARDAAPARGRQAASAHEPRHPPAADPDAVLAQLGVDAGTAVGPPARLEDRGDPPGEAGILARAAAGPAAQPSVEAARRDAHETAQPPHREGRALGGDEAVPHVGTASRAKKAAARLRISFSCSSRLFSRFSRASSAASAFCRARASAEPAARRSLRHVRSWLAWTPSSAATCCRALPLSSSRLTASALYSAVNRRRLRSCAIVRSRCWWNLPYEGVHPARAGSGRGPCTLLWLVGKVSSCLAGRPAASDPAHQRGRMGASHPVTLRLERRVSGQTGAAALPGP